MIHESIEITAATVAEARKRAMEYLGVDDASGLEFEVLEEGSGAQTFSVLRRDARIVARRRDEGFGRVGRELPDSIPEAPPAKAASPLRRIGLSPGGVRSRPMPKPDIVMNCEIWLNSWTIHNAVGTLGRPRERMVPRSRLVSTHVPSLRNLLILSWLRIYRDAALMLHQPTIVSGNRLFSANGPDELLRRVKDR